MILAQLKASKMMASTMANPQSSQSHVIYLFAVVVQLEGGESCRSSFALADLAGSERLIQSGVSGVQKQVSLLAQFKKYFVTETSFSFIGNG